MDKTYSIFKIYDYKGGELNSRVNLNYERFIQELGGLFEGMDFQSKAEYKPVLRDNKINTVLSLAEEKDTYVEYLKKEITEYMKDEDFYGTYAGGDCRFCGEIYEVSDNKMKEVGIENYVDDIAKYMATW